MIESLKEHYDKNGYICLDKVIDDNECDKLRDILKTYYKDENKEYVKINDCLKHKEIYSLFYNQKIISAFKSIFGSNVYVVPELHVQINQFPDNPTEGWHYDGQSERNNKYMNRNKRQFCRVGIYLQDNTYDLGGGIDIISNKIFKKLPLKINNRIEKKIINFLALIFKKTVNTHKGSAIFFDSRLPHKGTFPNKFKSLNKEEIKKNILNKYQDYKYAIYYQIGSKEDCEHHIKNSIKRSFINYQTYETVHYFTEYLKLIYPDDFPKELIDNLEKNGIKFKYLQKDDANFFSNFQAFSKRLI